MLKALSTAAFVLAGLSLGATAGPIQVTKIYYKVSITADGCYEGEGKLKKEKITTNKVIEAILEDLGYADDIKAKNCDIIACLSGNPANGEIDIEETRWYLYCKKAELNMDITAEKDGGLWIRTGDRFWDISSFDAKGSGENLSGKRKSKFTFLQFGMSLSFLDLFSALSGNSEVKLKNNELDSVKFDAKGFHNLSVDDDPDTLLGDIKLKFSKKEKNYNPPIF